jgi:NhaA family Na+:H+ antiporter
MPVSFLAPAGIVIGLVLGKVIGILGASWLMVRLNLASLPKGIKWKHIMGIGLLAGIGFTLSLFIAELSFDATFLSAAKISIFIASILSAISGLSLLIYANRLARKQS